MPELPHLEGCRATTTWTTGARCSRPFRTRNVVMCHIGTGSGRSMAPDAPIDNRIVLATQISAMCAPRICCGACDATTEPEVRVLEGRHRLILSSTWTAATGTTPTSGGCAGTSRQLPSESLVSTRWRRCHRQDVAEAAPRDRDRHHRLGVRLPRTGLLSARRAREGSKSRTPAPPGPDDADIVSRSPGPTPAGSSAGIRSPVPSGRRGERRRAARQGDRESSTSRPPAAMARTGRGEAAGWRDGAPIRGLAGPVAIRASIGVATAAAARHGGRPGRGRRDIVGEAG